MEANVVFLTVFSNGRASMYSGGIFRFGFIRITIFALAKARLNDKGSWNKKILW